MARPDSTPESAAGKMLAALAPADRRRTAGVLLALAASLLADDAAANGKAAPLSLDVVRERLGLRPSRGPDRNRTTRERLRALGVPVTRCGRSVLVDGDALDRAIAAQAAPLRAARPRDDGAGDHAEELAASGYVLRSAGGRR